MTTVEVTLRENDVALTVYVNDDFSADGKNFGYIEISDGYINKKTVFWDNLEYFFKIGKKKNKSIKKELKEAKKQIEKHCQQKLKWKKLEGSKEYTVKK